VGPGIKPNGALSAEEHSVLEKIVVRSINLVVQEVFLELVVEFYPDGLSIWMRARKEMCCCFRGAAARGAGVIRQGAVYLVSILQWKPFMNKFCEDFAFRSVEASKGQLDDLPLDRYRWCCHPLEFVLQILEVSTLGGCVSQGSLEAANNNLSIDAKVGVTGFGAGIQLEQSRVSKAGRPDARASQSMFKRSGIVSCLSRFLSW